MNETPFFFVRTSMFAGFSPTLSVLLLLFVVVVVVVAVGFASSSLSLWACLDSNPDSTTPYQT